MGETILSQPNAPPLGIECSNELSVKQRQNSPRWQWIDCSIELDRIGPLKGSWRRRGPRLSRPSSGDELAADRRGRGSRNQSGIEESGERPLGSVWKPDRLVLGRNPVSAKFEEPPRKGCSLMNPLQLTLAAPLTHSMRKVRVVSRRANSPHNLRLLFDVFHVIGQGRSEPALAPNDDTEGSPIVHQ